MATNIATANAGGNGGGNPRLGSGFRRIEYLDGWQPADRSERREPGRPCAGAAGAAS
ncbi:MAG: hypothetical protein U0263_31940 [Polyangiaceae bacterium]